MNDLIRVILLLTVWVSFFAAYAFRLGSSLRRPRLGDVAVRDARKDAEREEQYRIQQEILNRRKNKNNMQSYMQNVEQRRQKNWEKAMETNYARDTANSVDPLNKFKENKKQGKVQPLGYEAPPPSRTGFSLPIPVNPIGIEKYDEGLRFDLRLPYAERGYEDPDADVMAKAGKFFGGLFGGGKKKEAEAKAPAEEEPPQPPPPKKKGGWPF